MSSSILVLDFGSQYNQLIVRTVRELGVYAEIRPADVSIEEIRKLAPQGIILSGGPSSVYDEGSPRPAMGFWDLDIPMLGICYGMQVMMHELGGTIEASNVREYGKTILDGGPVASPLLDGVEFPSQVWMSHGDSVVRLPKGFECFAATANTPHTAVQNLLSRRFGLQFHPEVRHSLKGREILSRFLFNVCETISDWKMENFVVASVARIRSRVESERVILGLSGGVDSSVMAALLQRALGEQVTPIFIDNGLLRLGEREAVEKCFRDHYHMPLICVDARETFLSKLKGVSDPEAKRKIIGATFVEVFEDQVRHVEGAKWLAQGTIYPDVIESTSTHGKSQTIKSHHNVGGLPKKMSLKILEPLRELFKDEVRALGRELGLPESLVGRHPFPGPGLGVRVVGEVTRESCDILRQADHIYLEEIIRRGLYDKIAQAFAVFLPVKSVGVMGDGRTYENVVALRAVTTWDFMTADWYRFDHETLADISNRIINEVRGINRVVYDITSKPPGTIEWE